LNDQALV